MLSSGPARLREAGHQNNTRLAIQATKEKNMATRTLKGIEPKAARPSKPKLIIFGPAGVGKTFTSMDFPNAYLIDSEKGGDRAHYTARLAAAGGRYFGPEQGSNDFATVTEEIITLATVKHPYKTLIIDSVTKLFSTQVSADLERMEALAKSKGLAEMPATYGAEKRPAINWLRRWIRWFDKLDMSVILIAHEKDLYKDGKPAGQTFDAWEKLAYELDICLQISKQGASRKAKVIKSRLTGFQDGETLPWDYATFAERYGRDIIESESVPAEMATDAQVSRFNELLAVVKVDEALLVKWSENGDAKDLSKDDLQKRIAYLEKLLPKVMP